MASHSPHPGVHEHGLADECDRCDELATRPLELDDEMFSLAWRKMTAVEYDDEGRYRSGNEAKLCRYLYEVSLLLQRHPEVAATPAGP